MESEPSEDNCANAANLRRHRRLNNCPSIRSIEMISDATINDTIENILKLCKRCPSRNPLTASRDTDEDDDGIVRNEKRISYSEARYEDLGYAEDDVLENKEYNVIHLNLSMEDRISREAASKRRSKKRRSKSYEAFATKYIFHQKLYSSSSTEEEVSTQESTSSDSDVESLFISDTDELSSVDVRGTSGPVANFEPNRGAFSVTEDSCQKMLVEAADFKRPSRCPRRFCSFIRRIVLRCLGLIVQN
ncbi:hypothetical protein Aperf_G00000121086 [Anoplocephala perfoliata]